MNQLSQTVVQPTQVVESKPKLPALITTPPSSSAAASTISAGLKKSSHPRIKFSKVINPSNVVSSTVVPPQQKFEIPQTSTVQPTTQYLIARKVVPAQTIATTSTNRVGVASNQTILKVFTDYEGTITTIPSQASTSDLTVGVMDDLDYAGIDDIDLPEVNFSDPFKPEQNTSSVSSCSNDQYVGGNQTEKYTIFGDGNIVFRKQDSTHTMVINESSMSDNDDGKQYACQHCGKRYRWKSTLRRHENVECGGKEPVHQCPYCSYKAKQRGNLGVHVRKHHSNLPPLATRRSKHKSENVSSDKSF